MEKQEYDLSVKIHSLEKLFGYSVEDLATMSNEDIEELYEELFEGYER
jgi:hypothetical protein